MYDPENLEFDPREHPVFKRAREEKNARYLFRKLLGYIVGGTVIVALIVAAAIIIF